MKTLLASVALALAFSLTSAQAEDAKPYPLDTCIVSGEKLGEMGKPVVFVKDGQEVRLCCKACQEDFDAEAAKFLKEIAEKSKK